MQKSEKVNQCGETCERAKLCAVCAKELSATAAPAAQPVSDADLIRLWGMRSDGPDNAEILSFARAVLALRPSAPRAPLTDEHASSLWQKHLRVSEIDGHSIHGGVDLVRAIERAHGIGQEGNAA